MQFKIRNTRIVIGFPFAAAVTLLLLIDRSGTAVAAFACCAVHEAGHLLALFCFSAPPEAVVFGPFGMRIDRGDKPLSYTHEAICAFAGPAANFVSALLMLVLSGRFAALARFAPLDAGIGVFNMLPVEPMDGGMALRSLLLLRFDERSAERVLNILTAVLLVPLTVCGVFLLVKSGGNFTLLAVSIYIVLYMLMKKRAA